MSNYATPDVYIEEFSTMPPGVTQVATAIPAFIGYTEQAQLNVPGDLANIPLKIFSMQDYDLYFGGPFADSVTINVADDPKGGFMVYQTFQPPVPKYLMYYAVKMYFDNGGGQCYIISVGKYASAPPTNFSLGDFVTPDPTPGASPPAPVGLDVLALKDEPTMIVVPEAVYLTGQDYSTLAQKTLAQCVKLGSRFAIFDVYDGTVDLNNIDSSASTQGTTLMQTDRGYYGNKVPDLSYGAAYYPFLKTSFNPCVKKDESNVLVGYPSPAAVGVLPTALNTVGAKNTALYNFVKSELQNYYLIMPPSGAIAGVYADTDNSRGVWKAPANVSLTDVVKPIVPIDNDHQGSLNIDPFTGKSINAIRAFTGKGTLVWGARTLAGNDNEWRYVPVRRFFIMVEQSIKDSIYWAVFEPNDANTWVKVRGMIENYLTQKWREGALAGATTKDAFYVLCGIGTTMTADDIQNGYLNVEVGLAPVRPAEFIVLKFTQKIQVS